MGEKAVPPDAAQTGNGEAGALYVGRGQFLIAGALAHSGQFAGQLQMPFAIHITHNGPPPSPSGVSTAMPIW